MYVRLVCFIFLFKQKTAYEMRISDRSSDVCSSDLNTRRSRIAARETALLSQYARGAARGGIAITACNDTMYHYLGAQPSLRKPSPMCLPSSDRNSVV